MGLMRFNVRSPERIADPSLKRVYISGHEDLPFHGRTYFNDDRLCVERRETASGALCVPWVVENHGVWMLSTTTLMERDQPYLLEVELARGLVYRVRNQLADWQMLRLDAPDDLLELLTEATTAFARSAVIQADPTAAAAKACEAITLAAEAAMRLGEVYAEQALAVRTAGQAKLTTLLGIRLEEPPGEDKADLLSETFSIMSAPCGWKDIEAAEGNRSWKATDNLVKWARDNRHRVCLGPLLEFADGRIPEWAYLFEGDTKTVATLLISHVEACVERYRGRVNLWNIASHVNRSRVLGLSDEQRLQLVARAVRRVRELDPQTPVTVCFDQPWGESLATEATDMAAIEFADALERADLGIAGFGIEINVGYQPNGDTPRSPLALSQMLDRWSLRLDLPLLALLTVPSSADADVLADSRTSLLGAGKPLEGGAPLASPESQAEWIQSYLPVMLAKNGVQVVMWNQLRDDLQHSYPHGGLIDAKGENKPALAVLKDLRSQYMN